MYRAASPFSPEHQQRAQPYTSQVAPGQVTYTTSTGPDGRVVYHTFKAVAASYQTPTGVVSGIQWVPASEATMTLPIGATPANSEFAASWSRTGISRDEEKALKEWQRDEEKRRKKEEKEAKRQREKEQRGADADSELRKARERDAEARQRRGSFNQGANSMAFPPAAGGGYPTASPGYPTTNPGYPPATPYTAGYNGAAPTPYDQRDRKYSTGGGIPDLNRQFEDLGIDRSGEHTGLPRPARYQTEAERTRKVSSNFGGDRPAYPAAGPYAPAAGPYAPAGGPYPPTYPAQTPAGQYPPSQFSASPNMRTPGETPQLPYTTPAYAANYPPAAAAPPMARPTTPYGGAGAAAPQYYPPNHVLSGQPIARATTPIPGAPPAMGPYPPGMQNPDPNVDQGQLAAPEGFSRPVNAAQAFTPFEPMKIQDMDELVQNVSRMPAVLGPHDVYSTDWNRLMQDLCLAWTGRLPAPGRDQKKSSLAADLIHLWNSSFFFHRGVEVVLYKGRERRTGPSAGVVDLPLMSHDDRDDDSSSSSSSSEDSDSDDGARYPNTYMYGQQGPMPDVLEQRRRRREMKAEKKRRRKEKKARRKAKQREKKYSLYITCVPNGGPAGQGAGMMAGAPMGVPGYGSAIPPTAAYGGGYGGMPGAY
ncbi:hypothetical protein FB45DRAFT_903294 [Roridomyces roridus]|uniref:Uncharacterized protein n=1 Tax=Roridomyces roridus TaxID=1738132 RepID=A0AAD7C482_9AGAR|nr:hypothetical protein FB45DRAFT_903294 [Roridomyces roridus]